jgi:hypothetical protein
MHGRLFLPGNTNMTLARDINTSKLIWTKSVADVMILVIFSPKLLAKNWRFLLKLLLVLKKFDHGIGF